MPNPDDDLLLAIIVPFLTPFFLLTTKDLTRAEQAALATLQRIQASTAADLLSIAQFIAFGLASLNTLGLAMDENINSLLVLKLNHSAAVLARCQERNRRIIDAPPARRPVAQPAPPAPPTPQEETAIKAESVKQVRIARKLQAVATKISKEPNPSIDSKDLEEAAQQAAELSGQPVPTRFSLSKDPKDLTWAYTYAYNAEECVNDPAGYAHGSQKEANRRARLLNTCSYEALCGQQADLSGLPEFKFEPLS